MLGHVKISFSASFFCDHHSKKAVYAASANPLFQVIALDTSLDFSVEKKSINLLY
ncbi:conserved domain protein [delta proteobacterium NaphS2]|nr:conserved domain protein [delta proteobacterium NaphS2]